MGENILELYGNKYQVHFIGTIDEKDINLIHKPTEKKLSKEAKELIEKRWNEYMEKNNNKPYDGDLVELVSIEKIGDKINLYYDYTKYHYTITSRSEEYKPFIEQGNYTSNHIAIPTLIKTKDNKILIGSDLKVVKNVQRWKFPGGFWEKCASRIIDNVIKECQEEIGDLELLNTKVIGIQSCNNATCITVLTEVNMDSNELNDYIKDHKDKVIDSREMAEIKFLDLDENELNKILNDTLIGLGSMGAVSIYNMIQYLKSSK